MKKIFEEPEVELIVFNTEKIMMNDSYDEDELPMN